MSTSGSVTNNDDDVNEDYVIGNGNAMRNGNTLDKPMQMNGLRHSQRDREGYLDRGMEVNSGLYNSREDPWQAGPREPNANVISGKKVADGKSRGVDHYMY